METKFDYYKKQTKVTDFFYGGETDEENEFIPTEVELVFDYNTEDEFDLALIERIASEKVRLIQLKDTRDKIKALINQVELPYTPLYNNRGFIAIKGQMEQQLSAVRKQISQQYRKIERLYRST